MQVARKFGINGQSWLHRQYDVARDVRNPCHCFGISVHVATLGYLVGKFIPASALLEIDAMVEGSREKFRHRGEDV